MGVKEESCATNRELQTHIPESQAQIQERKGKLLLYNVQVNNTCEELMKQVYVKPIAGDPINGIGIRPKIPKVSPPHDKTSVK